MREEAGWGGEKCEKVRGETVEGTRGRDTPGSEIEWTSQGRPARSPRGCPVSSRLLPAPQPGREPPQLQQQQPLGPCCCHRHSPHERRDRVPELNRPPQRRQDRAAARAHRPRQQSRPPGRRESSRLPPVRAGRAGWAALPHLLPKHWERQMMNLGDPEMAEAGHSRARAPGRAPPRAAMPNYLPREVAAGKGGRSRTGGWTSRPCPGEKQRARSRPRASYKRRKGPAPRSKTRLHARQESS